MNIVEKLYLCYKGMARTRSVFRHPRYYKPDHTVVADLSNAAANEVLMNILVRVKKKILRGCKPKIREHLCNIYPLCSYASTSCRVHMARKLVSEGSQLGSDTLGVTAG